MSQDATQATLPAAPPAHAQQPGFVVPPVAGTTVAGTPPAAAEPAPAGAADAGMAAAIAALTAAMQAQTPQEPAPVQAVTPPATGSLNTYDVAGIDDPILKSMATVMQTVGKGIDMDRALGKAIENGRVDLVDAAYLREVGGDNAEQLITIAQGIVQAVEAKGQQVTKDIHTLAGGEPLWNASLAAFNTKAPQELRIVVAQMLDSNKDQLIKAGAKMIVEYGKTSGGVPVANPLIQQGAAAMPQAQALSKEGFQEELRKLNPQSRTYDSQRGELFARRTLGRDLGM
jgi:hypothetical protein